VRTHQLVRARRARGYGGEGEGEGQGSANARLCSRGRRGASVRTRVFYPEVTS
jgi:hypothetical protein